MMTLSAEVIHLLQGKTLATAESCTGGGIGTTLTAVAGSSAVYAGGIISYCNAVKINLLGVEDAVIAQQGAVCAQVAEQMAFGVRDRLGTDIGISVTGLAGPGGDEFGTTVGTVYIGYSDRFHSFSQRFFFEGNRESVRESAIRAALTLIIEQNK